jgi:asparagine synthase (glutamine-hydrolysing)
MCGITGFFNFNKIPLDDPLRILSEMNDKIYHRGPDAGDTWFDLDDGIFLGHRRLSVLELSEAGSQPMSSRSGRYKIVFNGEIYNHKKLRGLIKHKKWRGNSDTETLLEVIEFYGLQKALKKLKGMFAFALWDKKLKKITLCRDRMGEKPLYYYYNEQLLIFSSELKGIKSNPYFSAKISKGSISLMMQYCYVPGPKTIYRNTYKLQPGSFIEISQKIKRLDTVQYWSPKKTIKDKLNTFEGSLEDSAFTLDKILTNSIESQMISDVPLGSFLSGGVDSSLVTAIMQSLSNSPIKTFSIGFHEKEFNEADRAKEIANYLGTSHTELYISQKDAIDIIPQISNIYCEPFSDCSQLPTYILSKMTKDNVTVALSGDGGDELFGGYNRYGLAPDIWKYIGSFPQYSRKLFSKLIQTLSPSAYNNIFEPIQSFLPERIAQANAGDKIHKIASILDSDSKYDLYQRILRMWQLNTKIIKGDLNDIIGGPASEKMIGDNFIHYMMAVDMMNYLPDDILVKVDRAAMSVGLETRVPFLDVDVVEFAWSLPINHKVKNGKKKVILNDLLSKYLPKNLFNRPKMGFGLPISEWLRGDLKDWAESLLNEKKIKEEGNFSNIEVRKKWKEHLSGKRNWQYQLWNVLMFQQWFNDQ